MRNFMCATVVALMLCGCSQMPADDGPQDDMTPPVAIECGFGEIAEDGACVTSPTPQIELGFGNPYMQIEEGGDMPTAAGFQGLMDALLSYRVHGFPEDAMLVATVSLFLNETGDTLVQDFATPGFAETAENGVEILQQGFTIFAAPADVWGREGRIVVEVHDFADENVSATLEQNVVLVEAQ